MSRKDVVPTIGLFNITWPKLILIVTLTTSFAGALFSTQTLVAVEKNIAAAKEAARPANVKVVKITTQDCKDCFNIDAAVDVFKKQNVKVEEEQTLTFDSPEAGAKILQFAIKRIPTYIVSGEVTKSNLETFVKNNGELKDSSFIFTKVAPVFIDTGTKQEVGKVTATILTDPSCSQCIDSKLSVESFKKSGIKIIDQKEIVWNSLEGQKLINQYKITKVPTFILSAEIDFYDSVKAKWGSLGTVEQDKSYVARNLFLPYRDLETNRIVGLVDLIYITDASCGDCYKADAVQKPILTRGYGVALNSERTVDVSSSEGQGLIAKYKIVSVPTILMSPEADQYTNLKNIWGSVGTVESDGWYVFRKMQQLGGVVYKDLTTNQVLGKVVTSPTPTGGAKR